MEYNKEGVRKYNLVTCEYDTWDNPYVFLNLTALEVIIELGVIDAIKSSNFDLHSGSLEEFKQIVRRLEKNEDMHYTCISINLNGVSSQEFPEVTEDLMYRLWGYMFNNKLF